MAINLYCKIPFGKNHSSHPEIIGLAKFINRTPSAVSWKLANFAHIDPTLKRKGATNSSKLDLEIWEEFFNNWDDLAFESEELLQKYQQNTQSTEEYLNIQFLPEGMEKDHLVKTRVNQQFFRRAILVAYDSKCCITGISDPRLLIASHIVPWSKDSKNRTNPRNGLCLNSLHDRAFDSGLITINTENQVLLSEELRNSNVEWMKEFFLKYEGKSIRSPNRFAPEDQFLEYHRNNVFIGV